MPPMKTERMRSGGWDVELKAVAARIAELDARIEAALAHPAADPDRLRRLLADLRAAEATRDRLRSSALAALQQPRDEPTDSDSVQLLGGTEARLPRQRRSTMSTREQVLAGLELLGVPAAPRTVAEAASARTGLPVDAGQLAR